jgi:outer membrane protein assembly factor BamB
MHRNSLALVVTFLAAPLFAQQPDLPKSVGTLPGEEQRTRDDLISAARLAESQRYDEAIRRYQQILAESGDLLVPVDANRSLPARWIVHQRLSAMPAEGLKLYRAKADDTARKWLDQGAVQRDAKMLEQVVSEAFCSTPAEQALQLLGDMALERGEFEGAQRWWRMLSPPATKVKNPPKHAALFQLLYPDSKDKGALAQAKQILALALQGAKEQASAELKAYRELHPSAEGFLAGRKAKYADTLQAVLDSNDRWNPGAVAGGADWLTFAGDASRNYRLASANTPYWPDFPMWQIPLPGDPNAKPHREADPPPGVGTSSRALAFHPVVIPGFVLVADALRVTAYHLATGKQAAQYDQRRDADNRNAVPESIDLRVPSRTDARYTLTVAGNRVYARFGATRMKEPEDNTKPAESDNWLVCLGLERDGDSLKLQYRWQIRARLLDTDPVALFEGTPVVQDGRLLVARTRFDGRQVITSIDCYDADAPDGRKEPPPLRWTRDVWMMEAGKAGEAVRHRADLLTMAGPFVVYCTHSGLIIALDAATGKRMWAYRYPTATSKLPDGILPRDLCPCIFAGGRIYAAPADADRIFCLDATTGENIWECSPANVVHLLGISRDKLFATLGGYPQGIRAYDANTGDPIWTKPDDGDRAPHGRGFLSDDFVFWPTRRGLKVLRQTDGEPQDAGSSSEPFGNIAFGEGCMIVATPTELRGFIPERMRLNFRQREVQQRPEDALAHYYLGLALADAGRDEEAMACFKRVTEMAGPEDYHRGRKLSDLASRRQGELILINAQNRWKSGEDSQAQALVNQCLGRNLSPYKLAPTFAVGASAVGQPWSFELPLTERVRLQANLMQRKQTSYPQLLDEDGLHSIWLTSADGMPLNADDLLVSLMDEDARETAEKEAGRFTTLLGSQYFRWSQQSINTLFETERDVPYNYRLLLFLLQREPNKHSTRSHRERAYAGLIQFYDEHEYQDAAQALRRRKAQENASPRFRQMPPASMVPLAITPDISPPTDKEEARGITHFRDWPALQLLDSATGEPQPAISERGVLWIGNDGKVTCESLNKAGSYWATAIQHDARNFALHADTIIVTGNFGVSRLRKSDGTKLWEILSPDPQPMPGKTPKPIFRTLAEPALPKPFSAFRLAGNRLFMLHGGQKLLALDVEAGRFLWQRWAPGAPICDADEGAGFTEHYIATDDVLLLQTTAGRYIGVDAVSGSALYKQKQNSALWASPPVLIDSQRAVLPFDAEHIVCLELASGKILWQQPIAGWSSLAGSAPQLRRDGSHLLLIVERNFGYELERWELETGKRDLPPIFLGRERINLADVGITAEGYALASGKSARAYSRDDGKLLWEMSLPDGGGRAWHAQAIRGAVLVYPEEALPDPAGRFTYPWPAAYHVFMRRQFPLFVVDSKAGKVLQEFKTPVQGPRATLLLGQTQAAIAVEGSIWRLKETK